MEVVALRSKVITITAIRRGMKLTKMLITRMHLIHMQVDSLTINKGTISSRGTITINTIRESEMSWRQGVRV